MHTPLKVKQQNLHYALVQKLDPINFPKMSGVMAAVLGFVLARAEGDVRAPHYLGRYADLARSWSRLISSAGLTLAERIEAECLFASQIGYFGAVGA